ncbi:MAG: signal peptidase I [Patescibacteria group bacterium]|nr:signal peptidase I [Patescibacteria group bacterium]
MKREIALNIFEIILIFLLFILPIRLFLFEPFFVKGDSMEPNFHSWDYLIIDKLTYFYRAPQRGEVIVFRPPFDDNIYYIKRIIGLPGERILIEESKITVFNREKPEGFVLNEPYVVNHYTPGLIDIQLKENEYFVLGDNREVSYDSRKWGPLKRERIVGRVLFQLSLAKIPELMKVFAR